MEKIKLLIFEDNEAFQKVFTELSEKLGFEIIAFSKNSQELLEQIKSKQAQVILIDLVVPEEDTLNLIEQVKSVYPQIPLIACSCLTDEAIISKALRAGCYDYICKPFKEKELMESIKNAVAQKNLRTG